MKLLIYSHYFAPSIGGAEAPCDDRMGAWWHLNLTRRMRKYFAKTS